MAPQVSLIPAPLPLHASLARRYADWMHQRVSQGKLRGLFVFLLADGSGSVEFRPGYMVDVIALMALGMPEEVATTIWHHVRSYDPEVEVLAVFVDRSGGPYSFVRLTANEKAPHS